MPADHGQIKSGSYYVSAPRHHKARQGSHGHRIISPDVQRRVAELHESGWRPSDIVFGMDLPRAAVDDIIATYEYRAEMYFKMRRRAMS